MLLWVNHLEKKPCQCPKEGLTYFLRLLNSVNFSHPADWALSNLKKKCRTFKDFPKERSIKNPYGEMPDMKVLYRTQKPHKHSKTKGLTLTVRCYSNLTQLEWEFFIDISCFLQMSILTNCNFHNRGFIHFNDQQYFEKRNRYKLRHTKSIKNWDRQLNFSFLRIFIDLLINS